MNKLDEIEEHIDKEGITLSTFTAKLLIRAVRQLGATYKGVRGKRKCADCGYVNGIHAKACSFLAVDFDVLALLEERGE